MPVTNMADAIIDSVPLVDPYSKAGTKQLNKQFGVKKANKRLNRAQNNYRQTIAKSSGFTDALNKIIERKQPLNQQLANAATDFSSVENPFVRADLMDRAESAIRGSRNNALGQGVEALTSLASAKQYGISNLQNSLSQKLSNRDQARQFAGTQYLDQLNFNRQQTQREQDKQFQYDLLARQREEALQQYKDQQEYDKSLGIGNFAPRGGGGGGGSLSDYKFYPMPDGTSVVFDPNSGQYITNPSSEAISKANTAASTGNTQSAINNVLSEIGSPLAFGAMSSDPNDYVGGIQQKLSSDYYANKNSNSTAQLLDAIKNGL